MSETIERGTLRRKKFWSFLIVDGLALTFLLGAFAGTENCSGDTDVTTVVTSIACGVNRVTKTMWNNSPTETLIGDQMLGIKLPNSFDLTVDSITHSNPARGPLRLDPCPPALRQLNEEFPPQPHERWLALLVPAVEVGSGENVTLVYTVSDISSNETIHERATSPGCDFTNPSRSYFNSVPLVRVGCGGGGGGGGGGGSVPSLSPTGRLFLVLFVTTIGLFFVGRRFRSGLAPATRSA